MQALRYARTTGRGQAATLATRRATLTPPHLQSIQQTQRLQARYQSNGPTSSAGYGRGNEPGFLATVVCASAVAFGAEPIYEYQFKTPHQEGQTTVTVTDTPTPSHTKQEEPPFALFMSK